jgi:hypothetical protein
LHEASQRGIVAFFTQVTITKVGKSMLEIVSTLTVGATAGTLFAAALGSLPLRYATRLALGAGVGVWIALAVAITVSGAVRDSRLVLPAFFMLPLLAAALAATSPAARRAMMAIPVSSIIALNAMRVLGVLMLVAAATGVMSGTFPYAAGTGDVLTGLFALGVARVAHRKPNDVRVLEWNIFGALDLVVAVALGATYATSGASVAMTTLPWSIIPLVLVPTYLIGHALVFAHVREAMSSAKGAQTQFVRA